MGAVENAVTLHRLNLRTMEEKTVFQKAVDWINGEKRDFNEGIAILQEQHFKPAVVSKLQRDGENGPAAAERLEFQLREMVKAYGFTIEPDTDPELHIFDGEEAPADHDEQQQLGIMDLAEKMEDGELQMDDLPPAQVIREYAAAYRQREKAMREMAEVGEKNDEESMAKRKEYSDLIDEKTALMERLYPLFEKYQSGAEISGEDVEKALEACSNTSPALPSTSPENSAATESGAAHTSEDDGQQAGTDILLSCHDPEVQQRIYRSTLQAVKDGKLSRTDIDASVRRIVYCKLKKFTDVNQREKLYKQTVGR